MLSKQCKLHLEEADMTRWQHFKHAIGIAWKLKLAAGAVFLHAFGRELDVDDEGGGKGFEKENILMQLAKVLDNSNQTTVTTDDGKTFNVTPDQARTLRKFGTTNNVKTPIRLAFTKDIQHSHGLSDFLDQPNDQAMHVLYVTKYLG